MTEPFEPITVVEEFVYDVLSGDPTFSSLIPPDPTGGPALYPAFSPEYVETIHATHDFAGPNLGEGAVPLGQGMALLTLHWDVTLWQPSMNRQKLRPLGKAAQAALTGMSVAGKVHRMVSDLDGSAWQFTVRYLGPVLVPADVGPSGNWQRVSGRYAVTMEQLP